RVDRTIAAFTPQLMTRLAGQGSDDPRPVFVIGMPRSGTTLVEQIVAAHPQAHGYGELSDISRIARAMPQRIGSIQRWPEAAGALGAPIRRDAAAEYLTVLARRDANGALRCVDKAPLNFHHAGLIALMFPRATIIWCRRDPRDICVSIYGENFAL